MKEQVKKSSRVLQIFKKITNVIFVIGFNRACLMGKSKVVEFLLEHAGDVLDDMMRMYDGKGMTGFMHACQWNKVEVVELLIGSSIGKSDVYEGFLLACQNKRKEIIAIIFQNDKFRKHILIKEEHKGNVIRKQYGDTELRQQIQWLGQNQEMVGLEMVISFDERNHQLDIEIKVNSTLNEEEADGNNEFGKFKKVPTVSRHQPAGQSRSSLAELKSKKLVKTAFEELNMAHLCPGRAPQ